MKQMKKLILKLLDNTIIQKITMILILSTPFILWALASVVASKI